MKKNTVKKSLKSQKKSIEININGRAAALFFDLHDEFGADDFKHALNGPKLNLAIEEFYEELRKHIKYDVPVLSDEEVVEHEIAASKDSLRVIEYHVLSKIRDRLSEIIKENLED